MSQGIPNIQVPSFYSSWMDGLKYLKAGFLGRKAFSIALTVVWLADALAPTFPGLPLIEICLLYFIIYEVIQKAWEAKASNRSDNGDRKTTAGVETRMFFNSMLFNFSMALMGLFLIIPGIWFATRASLAMIFVSVENKGAFQSLGMSVNLTEGRFEKTFKYMVLGPIGLLLCLIVPVFVASLLAYQSIGAGPMEIVFKAFEVIYNPVVDLFLISIFVPMLDLYSYYKQLDEGLAGAG